MKIGYFIGHFPYIDLVNTPDYIKDYAHGGTEIAAYNLAVEMAKRGNDIDVFTTSINSRNSIEIYPHMRIHRHATSFKIASANASFKLIYKPLNYDLDIVHAHSPIPYSDLPALMYAKRKKVPFLLTYQFDGQETGGSFMRNTGVSVYNKIFINRVLDSAEVIIATTRSYAEESPFLKNYLDKIVVIPNGINIDEVTTNLTKEESRIKLGLPLETKIILFFGSLVPYKGPDILLKAFKVIKKEFPDVKLIFAGRGQMLVELRDMAKKFDIEDDVIFLGFVEEEDKALYYKSADIFSLPSTNMAESFGIVNLEAMASGVPLVGSNLGGIPDIIHEGENGLLAKPCDYQSLANSLLKLLKDDDLRLKMGNNGKRMVADYSWDKIARTTEDLYRDILDSW
ncbi:glycosyltransferase family 4 protein [Methanobacterium sp.]|uniref:glycosyltransferase family 4 protein n=1 Tax=Methanobacterium sp. TaxID=2164 RepID=UPI003C728178